MNQLVSRVKASLDWSKVLAKRGNTQVSERYYVGIIQDQIVNLGGKIGSSAGSQQSVDIRDVEWPDGSVISIECKKVNKSGGNFMFNDTFIKPEVWYMFLWVDAQDVALIKGSSLIEQNIQSGPASDIKKQIKVISRIVIDINDGDETPHRFAELFKETLELMKIGVTKGVLSFFDYGQLFKNTMKFGNISSRPRPNWSIRVPCEAKSKSPE
jgi:hypothetical protein